MRFLSFCFILIVLSSCQKPTSFSPVLSAEEVSNEEKIQQKMVDDIKAKGGKPKKWKNLPNMRKQFERVGERIEKAGSEICLKLGKQENGCYYYFEQKRSNEINAVADGERIIIYDGMMRFIESDDELAAVMAHEFAHNLMQHIKSQKNNAMVGTALGIALDAIASSQGINSFGVITETGKDIAVLRYSVEFEKEADYIGLYIMSLASYDIQKASVFWRRMSIESPSEIYSAGSHPSNSERFVALEKAIYEISYKKKHKIAVLPDFKDFK